MSYKIAVASSTGNSAGAAIDLSFGAASAFLIYQVEDGAYSFLEERIVPESSEREEAGEKSVTECGPEAGCEPESSGCGCGGGNAGGCGGGGGHSAKVELLRDCRCVICRKIGFPIQKQLERRAITFFDVNCTVEEALKRIAAYFKRVDNHQSLRGISKEVTI